MNSVFNWNPGLVVMTAILALTPMACQAYSQEDLYWLCPTPKSVALGETIRLKPSYHISMVDNEDCKIARAYLERTLTEEAGWLIDGDGGNGTNITISMTGNDAPKEGYRLSITESNISIVGNDRGGLFRGIGRLASLLSAPTSQHLANGDIKISRMEIQDSPDVSIRGMHLQMCYVVNRDVVRRAISAMAKLGFNVVIMEIGGRVELTTHPECSRRPFWPKSDLKELVRYAASMGIRAIPAMNTIGHFDRGPRIFPIAEKAMDIFADDFQMVYFDIIDEVLDIFDNPPYFHIGTDEIEPSGAIAAIKSKHNEADLHAAYETLLNATHDHLKDRGSRMVVWHDSLLDKPRDAGSADREPANGANTYKALRNLNKGIIINYWNYEKQNAYSGLHYFSDLGFETWASPWYGNDSIANLVADAAKVRSNGIIGTTWDSEYRCIGSFIQVAEASWNAANQPPYGQASRDWALARRLFMSRNGKPGFAHPFIGTIDGVLLPPRRLTSIVNRYAPDGKLTVNNMVFDIHSAKSLGGSCVSSMQPSDMMRPDVNSIKSRFSIEWPTIGQNVLCAGINASRKHNELVIYTGAYGPSTRTNQHGIEWVFSGQRTECRLGGDVDIPRDGMVLSLHDGAWTKKAKIRQSLSLGDPTILRRESSGSISGSITVNSPIAAHRAIVLVAMEWPLMEELSTPSVKYIIKDTASPWLSLPSFQNWSECVPVAGGLSGWLVHDLGGVQVYALETPVTENLFYGLEISQSKDPYQSDITVLAAAFE